MSGDAAGILVLAGDCCAVDVVTLLYHLMLFEVETYENDRIADFAVQARIYRDLVTKLCDEPTLGRLAQIYACLPHLILAGMNLPDWFDRERFDIEAGFEDHWRSKIDIKPEMDLHRRLHDALEPIQTRYDSEPSGVLQEYGPLSAHLGDIWGTMNTGLGMFEDGSPESMRRLRTYWLDEFIVHWLANHACELMYKLHRIIQNYDQ